MQEAIAEIILKSEKTRKFVCDYRLKAAIKAMKSFDDDLSIHTPNEIIHMDMKNIKVMTMSSVPGISMRNVCLTIAYKSGINTNVFITENLAVEVDKEWRAKNANQDYICAYDDENLIVLKKKDIEYMTQHVMRYKESAQDAPPSTSVVRAALRLAASDYSRTKPVAAGGIPDRVKTGMAVGKVFSKPTVVDLHPDTNGPTLPTPVKVTVTKSRPYPSDMKDLKSVGPKVMSNSNDKPVTATAVLPKRKPGRPPKNKVEVAPIPKTPVGKRVCEPAPDYERAKIECKCGAGVCMVVKKGIRRCQCTNCNRDVIRDNTRNEHDAEGHKVALFTNYYNPSGLL